MGHDRLPCPHGLHAGVAVVAGLTDQVTEQVEIGIAKWWPDVERIAARAGVTRRQVRDVMDGMGRLEEAPDDDPDELLERSEAEYRRLRRRGLSIDQMPPWVRDGYGVCQRRRRQSRKAS